MNTPTPMPPNVESLRFLLILAGEFVSDDGLLEIVPFLDGAEEHWKAPLAAICRTCRDIQWEARDGKVSLPGYSRRDVREIAAWRPVQDADDAWSFLADHANCPQQPRLEIDGRWQW